jgi:hypothetical protein
MGKHVYCEKPLAHSIAEVRALVAAARERKVITQLGNQGHSGGDHPHVREWIEDGAIGAVHTVHACCRKTHSRIRDLAKLAEKCEVPPTLDWNLWLGPAPFRPYHPMYCPGIWRDWFPFGTGTIGDWVCHVSIRSSGRSTSDRPRRSPPGSPTGSTRRRTATRSRSARRSSTRSRPRHAEGRDALLVPTAPAQPPRPADLEPDRKPADTARLSLGEKGTITYGSHGAGSVRIIPEAKMQAYRRPPERYPRVKGHHQDWVEAIREGRPAGSNFDYGGPLTEIALLGVIAQRFPDTTLEWDGAAGRFTNCDAANVFVKPPSPRSGWGL